MIERIKRFAKNFNIDSKNIELKFSSEHELFIDALNDDLNTPERLEFSLVLYQK